MNDDRIPVTADAIEQLCPHQHLDVWMLLAALLLLPALCLSLLAVGLTGALALNLMLAPGISGHAASYGQILGGSLPDLCVTWASAIGACTSIVIAVRRTGR